MNRRYLVALALLIGSSLALQASSALATTVFERIPPVGAATLRLGIAAIIVLVATRPKIAAWKLPQWRAVVLLGIAMAGMNSMFYAAIERVPLAVVATIEMLGPLALAGFLSRRTADRMWVAIATAGVLAIGLLDSSDTTTSMDLIGLGFAFITAAFLAGYVLAIRNAGRVTDGFNALGVAMAIGAIVLIPAGGYTATAVVGDTRLTLSAIGLAVFGSLVPYSAELVAGRTLSTRDFGVLTSREPIFASLIGVTVLGQQLTWQMLLAMLAVISASVATAIQSASQPDGEKQRPAPNQPVLVTSNT